MIDLRRPPIRFLPSLRLLVWLLFALGLVVQPVMAAAGEVHELVHHSSASESHALTGADADRAPAADVVPDGQGSATLHLLLDFAHCCGSAPAMLATLKAAAVMPAGADDLSGPAATLPLQMPLPSPFKPPIIG